MNTQYQLLDTIIKSRLLSFDDEGYEDLLKMDIDSFRKRYRDASDEKLVSIIREFADSCEAMDAYGPDYMVRAYMRASDAFNSVDFDWGSHRQLSSRKKFCRWMFRQAYLNKPELHYGTSVVKKEDMELFRLFKPEDGAGSETIDIIFTMLLTFNVIRPFGSDSRRALKYGDPAVCRERMTALLEHLEEELPVSGVLCRLHSINQALDVLNDPEIADDMLPPAALWGMLNNVACDLQVNSSPAEMLDSHVEFTGYVMKGIWVDDADDGPERFWVFPDNKLMAFCFYYKNGEWILNPYEFAFYKLDYESGFDHVCAMATSRGNMDVMLKGKMGDEELARLTYDLADRDEEGDFQTIRFGLETGSDFPYWMGWRSFRRLQADDELAEKYMDVIEGIYRGAEMLRGFGYRNIGSFMTDSPDCLLGQDSEFLYLVDVELSQGGSLERINGNDAYPRYEYDVKPVGRNRRFSLFGVEISPEQPMYVVPRNPMFYEKLDIRLNAKSLIGDFPDMAERRAFLRKYEEFKETVLSTKFSDQVTIYKNLRQDSPAVLCFNRISRTFQIDEIIEWFGVRKFTSREELLKSDIFR